jgi:tRNA U34 5-methylaminomethyl-2-thiouridine-forming methyltransferase MnmC
MNLSIQNTTDGSQTIYSEYFQETYHSIHGAITESLHVFIAAGLNSCNGSNISVFETGFGTGLNALLTMLEAEKLKKKIVYHSIELFPLDKDIIQSLNYSSSLNFDQSLFEKMHETPWNEEVEITEHFSLKKIKADMLTYQHSAQYHVVYFDAFSPSRQPEMWTEEIFARLASSMYPGGILTTYCAQGHVRRTLQKTGFTVERLPGPPGKREMLRGILPLF